MKLQLSVCAKKLPSAATYRAVVSKKGGDVVGQTEDSADETESPSWSNLIHAEDLDENTEIEVAIYDAANDADVVASTTFKIDDVLKSPNLQALAKFTSEEEDEGAKICVRAAEQQNGSLQLLLAAMELPDTDWGLGLLRKQHTDPMYELFSYSGKKIWRSNSVSDDLNPTWESHTFELDAICAGVMSAPLRITVLDKDQGGATEYLGDAILSVDELMQFAASQVDIGLIKGGTPTQGSLIVKEATLLPQQKISREDTKALEAAAESLRKLEELMNDAEQKAEAAKEAQEKADAAKEDAESKQKTADEATAKQAQAHTVLVDVSKTLRKVAEAAKKGDVSGSLQIQLAAKDLPDTDGGILLRNKTDPMYEMYKTSGGRLHRSNVVDNSLNPTWESATVDLIELCSGKLDEPFLITVSDKDGGKNKEYLGVIKKSVNELVQAKRTDALVLDNQPKGAHGKLFVEQAELVDLKDLKKELAEGMEACEKAKTELQEATAACTSVQQEAEYAREAAALSIEAAEKAKDAAEAANMALDMAKMRS